MDELDFVKDDLARFYIRTELNATNIVMRD